MPGGKRQWRSSLCHLVQRSVPVANEPWASWPSGAGGEWNFAWKKITTNKKKGGGTWNMTFWKSLEFRVRLDLGSGFVCVFVFKGRLWFPFKKNLHSKKGWASWTFPQGGLTTKKPTTQGTKMPRIQDVKCVGRVSPPFNYRKKSEIIRNHQKNAIRASWHPKHTFLFGCFNCMIPNHYIKDVVSPNFL